MKFRRGFSGVATALGFCVLALAFGATQSLRRQHAMNWLARARLEQAARDLACSALEEADRELMIEVNRPGSPVFLALRGPVGAALSPKLELPHTRELFRQYPELELTRVEVSIPARQPLLEEVPLEWVGRVRTTAVVTMRAGPRGALEAISERQLRASVIAPPFDQERIVDLEEGKRQVEAAKLVGLDLSDLDRKIEMLRNLDPWRARATLVVRADANGSVQGQFEVLAQRLGRLDGIVLVDNAGGSPLVLRGRAFAGRCALVVTGGVQLTDVRMADPKTDLLTVFAYGDARLDGSLEGAYVLVPTTGEARRWVAPDLRVRGALALPSTSLMAPTLQLSPLETLTSFDGARRLLPDRIHVTVSPNLIRHSITANVP